MGIHGKDSDRYSFPIRMRNLPSCGRGTSGSSKGFPKAACTAPWCVVGWEPETCPRSFPTLVRWAGCIDDVMLTREVLPLLQDLLLEHP